MVLLAVTVPFAIAGFIDALNPDTSPGLSILLVGTVVALAGVVASVAATVKRLRDRGRNPHWAWAYLIVPNLLLRASEQLYGFNNTEGGTVLLLGGLAAAIWIIADLGFRPSAPVVSHSNEPAAETT